MSQHQHDVWLVTWCFQQAFVSGKADAHFNRCMDRFKTVSDDQFHSQVSNVLTLWYQRFPPPSASRRGRAKGNDEGPAIMFSASDGHVVSVSAFGAASDEDESEAKK